MEVITQILLGLSWLLSLWLCYGLGYMAHAKQMSDCISSYADVLKGTINNLIKGANNETHEQD